MADSRENLLKVGIDNFNVTNDEFIIYRIPHLTKHPGSTLDVIVAAAVDLADFVQHKLVATRGMSQVDRIPCEKIVILN